MPLTRSVLYIVATPIGNLSEVSKRCLDTLKSVDCIACEDTRNSGKLLSHFDIHTKTIAYHNFNETDSAKGILELLNRGEKIALISDAGYPLISDPGYELVNEVIRAGHRIEVISGPNAAINALVASGLPTTHYLFYGFLNAKPSAARKELEALKEFPYTLIFYEAPHRIKKTLALCKEVLGNRKAVVARELTKMYEEYIRDDLEGLCQKEEYKGEIVLLIEGYREEEKKIDLDQVIEEVKTEVAKGRKTKEAVNIVAHRYGLSKNIVYNRYMKDAG